MVNHAHASKAKLTLISTKYYVIVALWDNGKGFDETDLEDNYFKQQGLKNIKSRCEEYRGKFKFRSEKGRYTVVKAILKFND